MPQVRITIVRDSGDTEQSRMFKVVNIPAAYQLRDALLARADEVVSGKTSKKRKK